MGISKAKVEARRFRDLRVAHLHAEGLDTAQMAERLGISTSAVRRSLLACWLDMPGRDGLWKLGRVGAGTLARRQRAKSEVRR